MIQGRGAALDMNRELPMRQIHLDFHTSEKIAGIGEKFDPEDFARTLKRGDVESVTCFSKCHHGMIYHDTALGAKHPNLKRDLLKEQIDACHERDIRVPIYISVGFDELMARKHPEWLSITPNGCISGAPPLSAGWRRLCLNTSYVDYVQAETDEVFSLFEVDGLFYDIVAQGECCCSKCMEDMLDQGYDPRNCEDRRAFSEAVETRFKRRFSEMIGRHSPEATIFYNAGHVGPSIRPVLSTYTHLELESLPSGGWGYDHYPVSVTYARNLGLPFLGMTGRFHKSWADFGGYKNKAALEYECFAMLASGGGCSIGDQLHPTGEISAPAYGLIGEVYRSIKEKEPWCRGVQPVREIAVFSPDAVLSQSERVDSSLRGAYKMLVESHRMFDIVDEGSDFGRYSTLIFPDKIPFEDTLARKVEDYIRHGGSVILSHMSGLSPEGDRFALDFGVEFEGEAEFSPDYSRLSGVAGKGLMDVEYVMYEGGVRVRPGSEVERLGEVWKPYFNRDFTHFCSHSHTPAESPAGYPSVVKKGSVIYFAHPIFRMHSKNAVRAYKQMVVNALHILAGERLIITDAPTTASIWVNEQPDQSRYILHVLHYIPEFRCEDIPTVEDVIPLYGVKMRLTTERPVARVYMAPSEENVPYSADGEGIEFEIAKVNGHAMVVVEFQD